MKEVYETPKVHVHGTVAEMTQFFGASSARDAFYVGDDVFGYGTGSQDGEIVPR